MTDIQGKVVIVTGTSRGIGEVTVRQFAAAGAKVAFCSRSEGKIRALAKELQDQGCEVFAAPADATKEKDVGAFVDQVKGRYGRIDGLINNVGVAGPTKPVETWTLDEWRYTIDGVLTSTFLFLRAVAPIMKAQGSGSIINISSITGKRPLHGRVGYAAGKTGIIGLTRTTAAELGPAGIRVNCICPGAVNGERLNEVFAEQAKARNVPLADFMATMTAPIPMRTFVDAEDVAKLAIFLISDASRHITGEDINVAAGDVMY